MGVFSRCRQAGCMPVPHIRCYIVAPEWCASMTIGREESTFETVLMAANEVLPSGPISSFILDWPVLVTTVLPAFRSTCFSHESHVQELVTQLLLHAQCVACKRQHETTLLSFSEALKLHSPLLLSLVCGSIVLGINSIVFSAMATQECQSLCRQGTLRHGFVRRQVKHKTTLRVVGELHVIERQLCRRKLTCWYQS